MAKTKPTQYLYDILTIIEVVWVDAQEFGEIGWNDLNDILTESQKPCPIMHSVGYLVRSDKDVISLLRTLGEDVSSTLEKIPRAWVKAERTLRKGKTLEEFLETSGNNLKNLRTSERTSEEGERRRD